MINYADVNHTPPLIIQFVNDLNFIKKKIDYANVTK